MPTKHFARGTDAVVSSTVPADFVSLRHQGYTEFPSADAAKAHVTANKGAQTRRENADGSGQQDADGSGQQDADGKTSGAGQKTTGSGKTAGGKSGT